MSKQDAVLVLGAGNSLRQMVFTNNQESGEPEFSGNFHSVWTIDIDARCNPKTVWDLEKFPWPLPKEHFDEVHAYEVLEHLGQLGDYHFFFRLWSQIWEVLKPGGFVCASTPWWDSVWAFQDPGHRRPYSRELLSYLNQEEYKKQIGRTQMTDYRRVYPPPYSFQLIWDTATAPPLTRKEFIYPDPMPEELRDAYDKIARLDSGLEKMLRLKQGGYQFVLQKQEAAELC